MSSKQSTRWCFTLNNWTQDEYNEICSRLSETMAVSLRYAVVAKETGEEGTPHLQGYFSGSKKYTFKQAKALISDRAHLEAAKAGDRENQTYCTKEGDYVEFGTPKGKGGRSDLDRLCRAIKDGKSMSQVADLSPADYVRNYKGLANYASLQSEHYTHDDVRGIWIWGPPGTGKSHHARNFNPNSIYLKSQNKWFDGYAGEEVILLDDLDSNVLGHYLKIWADKWSCTGEIKGGTTKLCHKYFIVTSNYQPCELWPEDQQMCSAIQRRFEVIYMSQQRETLRVPEVSEPVQKKLKSSALTKFPELKLF